MAGTIYHNWQCTSCDFVTDVPVDLLCPICSQILRDPFQTQCCGSLYCCDCLQTLVNEGKPCFSCQFHVTAFRDVAAANRVNALTVKCSHEAYDCLWSGELGQLGEHLLQCSKKPVRCDLCGDTVLNEHLEAHKSTQCMKRTFRCPHCNNFESTYETVRDDHWPKCPYCPIPCPNRCSEDSIPRGKVFQHLREECEIRLEVKRMKEQLEDMTKQLRIRDSKIEQLEIEVKGKRKSKKSSKNIHKPHPSSSASCVEEQPLQHEEIKPESVRSTERVTELEQENAQLVEQVEIQAGRIKQLQSQNKNLKDNLARMEGELASYQEGMKDVMDKLRDDKEKLETKISILCDEKEQLETALSKLHDEKEKLEAKLSGQESRLVSGSPSEVS